MDRRDEDATRRGSSIFSPTQTLDHHRRLLSAPPPLPDPDPPTPTPDDGASNLKTPASPPPAATSTRTTNTRYIECMKNHAVGVCRHVVDGCREFMPSGEDGTMEALRCAVCDCHRNFHRREVKGGGGGNAASGPSSKKRFRTKFSQHQEEKMQEVAEKIGWRIQKQDEHLFEEALQWLQMLTYQGDTGADSHEIRANYPSSKRLKTLRIEFEEACSKVHLAYKKLCANIALDYYNDENDTRFELLEDETLDSYSFADFPGSWVHCSFNAKEDSSINEFFAELQYVYPLGPAVTTCEILVEGETQVGCENCKSVNHPVGYRGGFPGNIGHASNAMSDDDEKDSPATTLEYSDKAKANHKHNETLDYYNKKNVKKNDATVTIDHFVLKEPTYTPRAPTTYDEKVFCNYALDHYNKINGTKFAYVDDGLTHWNSFNRRLSSSWIHICFSASDASAVKLFFAEMNYYRREATVTVCKILEGETKGGCELCILKCIIHPVVGYHVG